MYNHEPDDYSCPLCGLIAGVETEKNKKQDIVFQNDIATTSIAPKWWANNPGSALVMPNKHIENIYDTPDDVIGELYKAVKKISIAMRNTYGCDGISTRQHNEPSGDQDVWHLHIHFFPRYKNDKLYLNHKKNGYVEAKERLVYAKKLRAYLEAQR